MRVRGAVLLAAGLTMVASAVVTAAPSAVGGTPPSSTRQAMLPGADSPAADARAARAGARQLRADVAAVLQAYLDDYGDRFTADESAQLLDYQARADRQLATVALATTRLAYLAGNGASSARVCDAARRAVAHWSRAKATADATWEDARRIMEPRLSLLEKLGAARDYAETMDRFDDLGAQLTALARQGRCR